jgi:hypothetical protein
MDSPARVNSGVYDAAAPSAHEAPLLTPRELEAALQRGERLAADARISVAGQEFSVFSYLINLLQLDVCLSAAVERPLPPWLEHKADASGRYPLHWAVILPGFDEDARVDLIVALIDAGADPNCRDSDTFGLRIAGAKNKDLASKCGGKTPLHHLCSLRENDHTKRAVEHLLSGGADANLEDFDGNTAVTLAQIKRNTDTVSILGAAMIGEAEAKEKAIAYERRCTEREEAWEHQGKEARIHARSAYLARLETEYTPRHPKLYDLSACEDFFEPTFLQALKIGTREAFESIRDFKELSPGLYQYRIFREEVCHQLMEEVDSFNAFVAATGIEVRRPNSMNRYGLILNDIGFLRTMDDLMRRFVQPLTAAFFSERLGGDFEFQSLHTFIVRYKMGEDLDLKTHADDSDMTLNICLGKDFEGARLYFHQDSGCSCGSSKSPEDIAEEFKYPHPETCRHCTFYYDHTPGVGLMHTGQHIHGVEKLTMGERSNLILWCRKRPYPEELSAELKKSLTFGLNSTVNNSPYTEELSSEPKKSRII